MGLFDMTRIGGLALPLLIVGCSPKSAPPIQPAAPAARATSWPAAIIDTQGQPSLEIVDAATPGAVELRPRHAMEPADCVLNGVAWELRPNHWGMISKDQTRRELSFPARPDHGPACNGKYLAIEANVDGTSVMWVIDSTTGRRQRTALPVLHPGYGGVFPVVDAQGELAYALAVSYSGAILLVHGERIDPLPGPSLLIRSTVDITQLGDSVLVHTDYVYVIAAGDRTLRGTFDVGGKSVWVTPSSGAREAVPAIAAVDYGEPWAVPREQQSVAFLAQLFDGDVATQGLLAAGDHTFAVRFVRPVVDPVVEVTEALDGSGPTITSATASGASFFGTPVSRKGGAAFPRAETTEAPPPNLHQIVRALSVRLTCGCSGNTADCEELCHVAEVACR